MINVAAQCEEAFKSAGDVGLNLFRRHSRVESRHNHDGNVDRREQIDRHPGQNCGANDCDHKAAHNNEVRIFNRKARHQNLSFVFSATTLVATTSPARNSAREPTTTRSSGASPETISTWFAPSSPSCTARSSMRSWEFTTRSDAVEPFRVTA